MAAAAGSGGRSALPPAGFQVLLQPPSPARSVPRPVRLLGVGVSHFAEATPRQQLSLWDVEPAERQRLRQVLSELQERYGPNTIHRGIKIDKK